MKKKILRFIRKILGTERLFEITEGISSELFSLKKEAAKIKNAQLFRGAIEDCPWLRYKSFAPGGWAMDNAALYTLFRILNEVKPARILEFGLGQSSKLVHQYAQFSNGVSALTIEHDRDWIDFFCKGLPSEIELTIKRVDTEMVNYNGFETLSYKNIKNYL